MLLRIAGINHFDPLGTRKLRNWIAQHGDRGAPTFVAPEWDQEIFTRVRNQREAFRRLAGERWPQFSPELLITLAESLGFEADSHTASFPNAEMLWLDQGRGVHEEDIAHYAEDRLALYAHFLNDGVDLANEGQVLATMSVRADERAAGGNGIGDRDQLFSERILGRAVNDGWGIVIAGPPPCGRRGRFDAPIVGGSRPVGARSRFCRPSARYG